MKLSCVVLTKNEEKNIEKTIKSVAFCDEVIIVDDYSFDDTLNQISKIKNQNDKLKIKIYKRHLNGDFAAQRNFGMEKSRGDWVLFLDADEEMMPSLAEEIGQIRPIGDNQEWEAFYIKRRDWFWGREVRFGEIPRWVGLIRLVKKNSGKWVGRVHEKFEVRSSKFEVKSLENYIKHYPHPTVKEFLSDVNFYSSLRAQELYEQGKKTNIFEIVFYPLGKFFLNYFFKLGFLDGSAGFVYAFMMTFHSFLVRAKLYIKQLRSPFGHLGGV